MSKEDNSQNKSRRSFLKASAATGVIASSPMFFTKGAYAAEDFRNAPIRWKYYTRI